MASIDFPNSPTNGQIFSSGGKSWKYNSTKGIWQSVASTTTKNLTALDESIIPSANVTYDLGSSTNAFRDLYLSGNSIFLGAGEITSSSNGSITLPEGSQVGGVTIGTGSGGATVYANTSLLPKVELTAGEFAFVGNTLFITNGSGWYSVGVVNQSPELTLSTSSIILGASGNTINFTFTATDPDGPEPTVSISNSGIANTSVANINLYTANSTVTVDNFSGDPYNATITLTATDGINQTNASVTLTVSYLSALWDETVLSIGTSSTNSLNNSTFIDRSTNAHTVTPTGSPVQTAFHPYLENWSVEFDGSGDYITYPDNTDYEFGTSAFTIELFVYFSTSTTTDYTFVTNYSDPNQGWGFQWRPNQYSSAPLRFFLGGSGVASTNSFTPEIGKWYHLAVTRSSGTTKIFVDGTEVASGSDTNNYNAGGSLTLGRIGNVNAQYFNGYISNVRIVKGTALYTTNFTRPTVKLAAVTNTVFLSNQSNKFIDNSTNGATPTVSGDPKISAFNPFGQGSEYAVGENKGSLYADGDDYLTSDVNVDFIHQGNNFTIQGWVYSGTTQGDQVRWCGTAIGSAERGFTCWINYNIASINLRIIDAPSFTDNTFTLPSTPLKNQWNHIAFCHDGSNVTAYFNGEKSSTIISSSSAGFDTEDGSATGLLSIAKTSGSSLNYLEGYISDFKISNTASYSSSFTPPTAPVGNTNASLYLPMDNAGIFDKTGNHTLTLFGNISTSTTQTKFADTSMYFDGTGDYVSIEYSDNLSLGTGDFTIEGWSYPTAVSDNESMIVQGSSGTGSFQLRFQSGKLTFNWGTSSNLQGSTVTTANDWYHVAVTRENSVLKIWLNGSLENTQTSMSHDFNLTDYIRLGVNRNGTDYYNGYIENLQVLRGVAKYTTNFTVPNRTQGRIYQAES